LQPVQKKQQDEVKFTFNVGKCDKIFDELLKNGNIKIDYIVPPADELRHHAYCKWHNSFSHATNDYNVFRRQIQSAINERLLKFQENTEPFPMNVIDFEGKKVLIRTSTTNKGEGNEVVAEPPKLLGPHAPVLVPRTSDGYACAPNNLTGSVQVPQGPWINDLPPRSWD
jgi:hypothetical protein